MKTESKNQTVNGTKTATAALADINAQIAELHQKRIELSGPLKSRYSELRKELADMVTEIKNLDGNWTPEPLTPKAEATISGILTTKGPLTLEEVVQAVGDAFTSWKIKTVLKKKSTGPKALFTVNDGRYSLKAAA
jgi:hypothetical protein